MRMSRPVIGFVAVPLVLFASFTAASAECTGTVVIPAGTADGFVLPAEPTTPSREYSKYMADYWPEPSGRWFDEFGAHKTLIHTFAGWSGPACGARLEVRVRGGDTGLPDDDTIRLGLLGGLVPDAAFQYSAAIASLVGTWGPGATAVLDLDLANLPPSASFPVDILGALANGVLDIALENDTTVDYAILEVCPCVVSAEQTTWGRTKAGYRNP